MVSTQVVPVVLTPEAIEALPLEPLGRLEGVQHRVLWRDDTSMSGVLTVAPGRNGTSGRKRYSRPSSNTSIVPVTFWSFWVMRNEAMTEGTSITRSKRTRTLVVADARP